MLKPTCARRPRSRARRRALPTCAPIRSRNRRDWSSPGSAAGFRSTTSRSAPDRGQARLRRAADLRGPAPGPGGAGRRRHLDDHRRWIDRMRTMAGTAVAAGVAVLALVLAVTVLSVTFATRGAMATNRPIIEVLHYVGATNDSHRPGSSSAISCCSASRAAPSAAGRRSSSSALRKRLTPGLPGLRAATRPPPCSATSPSVFPATSRSSPRSY